jgi:hypothetical protein
MPTTHTSPIAELDLPVALAKELVRYGYKTVGSIATHTAAHFTDRRFNTKDIAAITKALAAHGLEFAKPIGEWNTCGTCPTCKTCGNLRAVDARNVGTDLDGRAKHLGGGNRVVCDDCHAHHRALVESRALELAGRLV